MRWWSTGAANKTDEIVMGIERQHLALISRGAITTQQKSRLGHTGTEAVSRVTFLQILIVPDATHLQQVSLDVRSEKAYSK